MEAEFAIDGDGVGDSFGLEEGRVVSGPRGILEWGGVPESFPEFGGYVRGKRLQKYQHGLPDSAFSASEALHLIEEGHEVGDASVEAEALQVFGDAFDEVMEVAQLLTGRLLQREMKRGEGFYRLCLGEEAPEPP
jgi:hypothetical protein